MNHPPNKPEHPTPPPKPFDPLDEPSPWAKGTYPPDQTYGLPGDSLPE